ncbi:MAG: hypothetical protein ABEJ85_01655 [Haloarculaceae archaeon]
MKQSLAIGVATDGTRLRPGTTVGGGRGPRAVHVGHRDDATAGVAEFVPPVGFPDEVLAQLPEVVAEPAGIANPDALAATLATRDERVTRGALVGADALDMRPAVVLGGVGIGAGAFLLGPRTLETVGEGITDLPVEAALVSRPSPRR